MRCVARLVTLGKARLSSIVLGAGALLACPATGLGAAYELPWANGQTWNITQGLHPTRSWDFQPPGGGSHNDQVLAIASGTARITCTDSAGQAIVSLSTAGGTFRYVHLQTSAVTAAGITGSSVAVQQGQVLGRLHPSPPGSDPGCGWAIPAGASHLHLEFPSLPFTVGGTTFSTSGPVGGSLTSHNALNNPIGNFDAATGRPGAVWVRGWAADRDNTATAIPVHIYVGGHAGQTGAEGHAIDTGGSRPDVNTALGIGSNHGFDKAIPTSKRGSQLVCAYGINIGGGQNVELGCRTVTIADPDPVGWLDGATGGVGTVKVVGWAADRSDLTTAIAVHIYVGGRFVDPGVEGHAIDSGVYRPDVDTALGFGTNHGFSTTIKTAKRGSQLVCAYGINVGLGSHTLLRCLSVTISNPPPVPTPIVRSGTAGPDTLVGASLGDVLRGLAGNDILKGLVGNDRLFGGLGADRIYGGQGSDKISGGRGRDIVAGGAGNDLIDVRDGVRDTVNCGVGVDSVNADPTDRLVGCERRTTVRVR